MRIMIVHNRYQQRGGEDQVFEAEVALLEQYGHQVTTATVDNREISELGRLSAAASCIWSSRGYRCVRELAGQVRPEIVHFHNTFPLISPAGYYAAQAAGAAVVQTLHNYRLLCPAATLYRDGGPCEACCGKPLAWPAVRHGCYRGSRVGSAVVTAMLGWHHALRTYRRKVDAYVALTTFARAKFERAGFPAGRIHVKPNFVAPDPGAGSGAGGYALFVGRLTEEKGVKVLLEAWKTVGRRMPLKIAGDGPLEEYARETSATIEAVEFLGRQARDRVLELMKDAALVVVPSTWYEGFPMTVVEAWACGTPVVASDLGSLAAVGTEGRTKWSFQAGDSGELAARVLQLAGRPDQLGAMRGEARLLFQREYTPARNYEQLLTIYRCAAKRRCAAERQVPEGALAQEQTEDCECV